MITLTQILYPCYTFSSTYVIIYQTIDAAVPPAGAVQISKIKSARDTQCICMSCHFFFLALNFGALIHNSATSTKDYVIRVRDTQCICIGCLFTILILNFGVLTPPQAPKTIDYAFETPSAFAWIVSSLSYH